MNFKLNHIQHIGIPVTDLTGSEEFYNRLGFKNVMTATFNFNGANGNVTLMKYDEMIIDLYQMPAGELQEIGNRKNGHIDHVAFDVYDIDTAFSELKKLSFNIIKEASMVYLFGKMAANILILPGQMASGWSLIRFCNFYE